MLTTRDAFVAAMSPVDRAARLQVGRDVSEGEYFAYVGKQALDWSDTERRSVSAVLDDFRRQADPWQLALPSEVVFVKTTGREEGGAAYCRGAAVVLPSAYLSRNPESLHQVVFHELFHVYSSHHPELRRALYAVVGYELCPEIWFPPAWARHFLTNPDAPRRDAIIRVRLGDQHDRTPVMPVLWLQAYDEQKGGPFFRQLGVWLMELDDLGTTFRPKGVGSDRPVMTPLGEVTDYRARVGLNTDYVIHPEEILADNFVLLVDRTKVPSPEILEKLDAVLRKR